MILSYFGMVRFGLDQIDLDRIGVLDKQRRIWVSGNDFQWHQVE